MTDHQHRSVSQAKAPSTDGIESSRSGRQQFQSAARSATFEVLFPLYVMTVRMGVSMSPRQ